MIWICFDCGHAFYEEDARYSYTADRPGRHPSCPECGGDFEEASFCRHCGHAFHEDDLTWGWCNECLEDAVYYDDALKYMTETERLFEFIFVELWASSEPDVKSATLLEVCTEYFKRMHALDMLTGRPTLLNRCKKYILREPGEYADWLNDQPENKKRER